MVDFNPNAGALPFQKIFAHQLSEGVRRSKFMRIGKCALSPLILQYGTQTTPVTVPTLPTANQDNVDTIFFAEQFGMHAVELYQTTAQTLMPARDGNNGMLVGGDQVNNETVEYVPGGNNANNPLGYLAGTDPGVFLRATFKIADVSGVDQFILGFRKQQSYVVPTSFLSAGNAGYSDFYGVGFSGSSATNRIKTMSDKAASGSTTVFDTLVDWADNETHELQVRIKGRYATAFVNGVRLGDVVGKDGLGNALSPTRKSAGTAPPYQFASGLFLIPFIVIRYDVTSPGNVWLTGLGPGSVVLECGQLADAGLAPEQKLLQAV